MQIDTNSALVILNALEGAKIPSNVLPFAWAVSSFESSGYSHTTGDNNYSGLTWSGSAKQRLTGAYPMQQQPDGSNRYTGYPSIQQWADDFYNFLCFNSGGLGRPIDATNLKDFIHRLKANRYFGANESTYLAGVKNHMDYLLQIPGFEYVDNNAQVQQWLTAIANGTGLNNTDIDFTDEPGNTDNSNTRNNVIIFGLSGLLIFLIFLLILLKIKPKTK